MGSVQLGIEITDDEANKILNFFNALSGKLPEAALKYPVLPASTDATPKPELDY